MKLRAGQEYLVKKAIFWQFRASQYTQQNQNLFRIFISQLISKISKDLIPMIHCSQLEEYFKNLTHPNLARLFRLSNQPH